MMMFSSGAKVEPLRRIDDELCAGKALADVVVGVAFEVEGHALGHEGAEALAGGAVEMQAGWCPRASPRRRSGG